MNAIAIKNTQVQVKHESKTSFVEKFIKLFAASESYAAGVMAMYGSYYNPAK